MNKIIWIFLLFFNVLSAQNEEFIPRFVFGSELKNENLIERYELLDFSHLWMITENHFVYGIIGDDHQRIRIKIISVSKDQDTTTKYILSGKSNVKGNIYRFNGVIEIEEIFELVKINNGVDDEYKNRGIKSEGILIASYSLIEEKGLIHSGVFKGKLYTKWYLDANDKIQYDVIQKQSDGYMNNAFIGTWQLNDSQLIMNCNWGDYRVPIVAPDFDIGAAFFSPNKEYSELGWNNYREAYFNNDSNALSIEKEEWWK